MAKIAKRKKNGQVSIHSRAAKRATSPSIDIDKSLKSAKPPTATESHILHTVRNGAGVGHLSRRRSKGKQMRREQRVRRDKAKQRALAVLDQTEQKVERSKSKGRVIRNRRVPWEEINGKLPKKAPARFKSQPEAEDEEWEVDEDMTTEREVVEGVSGLKVEDPTESGPLSRDTSTYHDEDEDEIL